MCHFEATGAHLDGEIDDALDMVEVLAVHRRIDRERQPKLANPAGNFALLRVSTRVVGDAVGVRRLDILDRKLHVIETTPG